MPNFSTDTKACHLINMTIRGVVYTSTQIDAYLARIGFPPLTKHTVENVGSKQGLDYLRQLQKCHMQAVPFEKYGTRTFDGRWSI